MSSTVVTATKRNVKERETRILGLRSKLRQLPAGHPRRAAITAHIKRLLTEIAAMKASIHYYKPTAQLSTEISAQRKKVAALTSMFKRAAGKRKAEIGKQLRREAKELNEMLAAAQIQQVQVGLTAPLPKPRAAHLKLVRGNPVLAEQTAAEVAEEVAALAAETEGQPDPAATPDEVEAVESAASEQPHPEFEPSEFSLEDSPDFADEALSKVDEIWDDMGEEWQKLGEYRDEEGEVWYKNPVVLVGAGVAAYLILRRR